MSPQAKVTSEILTVMFTDLVNYTRTTEELNRELFNQMHDAFDSLSLPLFRKFNGKVVKKIGDSFLATFKSPTDAVLCGAELQNAFERYNDDFQPRCPLKIRVAIHAGEVLIRDGDIYGDAVNVASRMMSAAGPSEIIFSQALFLAMNKNEVPFVSLGLRQFKGVKYPVQVFRVKGHYDRILRMRKMAARRMRRLRNFFLTLAMLGLMAVVISLAGWYLVNYLGFHLDELFKY